MRALRIAAAVIALAALVFGCWLLSLDGQQLHADTERWFGYRVAPDYPDKLPLPTLHQLLHAFQVDLGLVTLRHLRADALVEGLDLQRQLGVGHERDVSTASDEIALAHIERRHRAADAGASDELADRLDGGNDRLAVVDGDRFHCHLAGQCRRSRGSGGEGK